MSSMRVHLIRIAQTLVWRGRPRPRPLILIGTNAAARAEVAQTLPSALFFSAP